MRSHESPLAGAETADKALLRRALTRVRWLAHEWWADDDRWLNGWRGDVLTAHDFQASYEEWIADAVSRPDTYWAHSTHTGLIPRTGGPTLQAEMQEWNLEVAPHPEEPTSAVATRALKALEDRGGSATSSESARLLLEAMERRRYIAATKPVVGMEDRRAVGAWLARLMQPAEWSGTATMRALSTIEPELTIYVIDSRTLRDEALRFRAGELAEVSWREGGPGAAVEVARGTAVVLIYDGSTHCDALCTHAQP